LQTEVIGAAMNLQSSTKSSGVIIHHKHATLMLISGYLFEGYFQFYFIHYQLLSEDHSNTAHA
jgi:hypothetical protein